MYICGIYLINNNNDCLATDFRTQSNDDRSLIDLLPNSSVSLSHLNKVKHKIQLTKVHHISPN